MATVFPDFAAFLNPPGPLWLTALDAFIKATLLLAAAGLATVAMRRASASLRHRVWTLALLGALVLPALSLFLPRWQVPLVTLAPAIGAAAAPLDAAVGPRVRRGVSRVETGPGAAAPVPGPILERTQESRGIAELSWTGWLAGIWALGMLAVAGRLGLGLLAVQWMSRRTERVTDAPWVPLARELAAEVGVGRKLTFLRSAHATMPMAWGVLQPSVLMPADADGWPAARLRIVLLHELAHIKRRDCLTHALAQVACAVHWFNPLAWVAARHLRMERERACDDLVLASGTRGSDYATELLEIARVMRSARFPAVLTGATLAMAHRSQLEGRLIAILDPGVPRSRVSGVRSAAVTAAMACALIPLASLQPWAYANPDPAAALVPFEVRANPTPGAPQPQPPAPRPGPEAAPRPVPAPEPADPVEAPRAQASAEAVAGLVEGVVHGAIEGTIGALLGSLATPAVREAQQAQKPREPQEEKKGAVRPADPRLVAALTAALTDIDADVRKAAMHALAQLRDPAVFEPMVQALSDSSADVREHAAMGLAQLRDRRALEPLTHALADQIASVREQVVFALGQLRDPLALDALTRALRDSNPGVREQAAFAIGQLRDKRGVEPLISALKDADADVREHAAFGLGQIRDRAAVEALVIALKDLDADVREQAAFALGQIRDPRAIDALTGALNDLKASVREQAAFALGQLAR